VRTRKPENKAVYIALIALAVFLVVMLVGMLLSTSCDSSPSALSYLLLQGGGLLTSWSLVALCVALLYRWGKKLQSRAGTKNLQRGTRQWRSIDDSAATKSQAQTSAHRGKTRAVVSLYAALRAVIPIAVFMIANEPSSYGSELLYAVLALDLPFFVTCGLIAVSIGVWTKWRPLALRVLLWLSAFAALTAWGSAIFYATDDALSSMIVSLAMLPMDVGMFIYLFVPANRDTLR